MQKLMQLFAGWLCLIVLLPAPAQTPAPKDTAPASSILQVTTHLAQVNVVVHGKKNEPVDDPTQEDFKVHANGQLQQIATFSLESAKLAEEKLQKAPALPQNTFTNRVELRPKSPNN